MRARILMSFPRQAALPLGMLILCLTTDAGARPFRADQIPNGRVAPVNGCGNCHVNPNGGGARNLFGQQVETGFLSVPGSTGNVLWGPALAGLDADGDGRTNGTELLDPPGAWDRGPPADPNPGNPANVATSISTPGSALLLGCSLVALTLLGLRSRRR
jgi:hypothetical protein